MIEKARRVAASGVPDLAARESYLAMFHAAQAYIFARTGKLAKTHRGARSEFARLAHADTTIDAALPSAFGRAYRIKENVDYAVGIEIDPISGDEADAAIAAAQRVIDAVAAALAADP